MGWLIVLAVIAGLAVCPIGVSAKYDADGAAVYVTVAFLHFAVYPSRKNWKDKHKKSKKEKKAEKDSAEEKKGGSISELFQFVHLALDFLGELRRKLRVKRLEAKLTMAGDDPCDLAVNYGRANAAVGALIAKLENLFVIKKRNVQLQCDFTAEESCITAQVDLRISFSRAFVLAVKYAYHALRKYLKMKNTREGGAENE